MIQTVPNSSWLASFKPYLEKETLAAFALGISSGFPYAMIGATLTSRLAQSGIDKKTVTAFTLAFLVYNLKPLWAWVVDGVRLPGLSHLGQRVSWLVFAGLLVMLAVANLAIVDPKANLQATVIAAVLVGLAGATFDIVIDAYRIETLKPYQMGVGSGMTQYGWRIGSVAAGALALCEVGQAGPVACRGGAAVGQQQRRLEARQIEQQLVGDPAPGALRVVHQAAIHCHFQALGVAVAADRQLRAGQAQQLPGRTHRRTPNWCRRGP